MADWGLEDWARVISGGFVAMACALSSHQIRQHLLHSRQRALRNYTVRILLMVPIYATQAWLGLRFIEASFAFTCMRELYEALVIFTFMQFLLAYLGGPASLARKLAKKGDVKHLAPMCHLQPWTAGPVFLRNTMFGALQYVPVMVLTTCVAIVAWLAGLYTPGDFSGTSVWLYVVVVKNLSQMWALYCLVLFYRATARELSSINPFVKFITIKLIVFFTFWQACAIQAVEHFVDVKDTMSKIVESDAVRQANVFQRYGTGLENFILCMEMFGFAIAHRYAFPHAEFGDYSRDADDLRPTRRSTPETPMRSKLVRGIDFTDIFEAATDLRALDPHTPAAEDKRGLMEPDLYTGSRQQPGSIQSIQEGGGGDGAGAGAYGAVATRDGDSAQA